MKINTDSWHFALWQFTHTFLTEKKDWEVEAPVSLWRYVGRIIVMPIPVIIAGLFAAMLLFIVLSIFVIVSNTYGLLTLRGFYWLTGPKDPKGDMVKLVYPFKKINQGSFPATEWAKFFWLNLWVTSLSMGVIMYLGYYPLLSDYLLILGGFQSLIIFYLYWFWKKYWKSALKNWWAKVMPIVEFIDPNEEDEDEDEVPDWV